MSSGHVLTSEPVLGVLCSVLAALWGFFKSSAWWDRLRRRRFGKALRAIEAGVEQTYRTYVRAIKEARADGKLTDEERETARSLAREAAIAYGRAEGIDVLRELGEDYVDLWVAKVLARLKRR